MPSHRGQSRSARALSSRHELAAAYALDALDEAERARFARHLRRCPVCTADVRRFQEVAAELAFAAATEPPPGLRGRVLAAAARTAQEPTRVPLGQRLQDWLPRLPAGGWMPRLATATAAVAVVAVVVLSLVLVQTRQQLDSARSSGQAIAAVLAAPDVRTVSGPVNTGGRATVVLSADRRELVVSTSGLAALPAGKTYELWLIGPKSAQAQPIRAAGLLPTAVAGSTTPVLASGMRTGDELGMTVEPAGGSKQPTTTPILLLSLHGAA